MLWLYKGLENSEIIFVTFENNLVFREKILKNEKKNNALNLKTVLYLKMDKKERKKDLIHDSKTLYLLIKKPWLDN